MREHGDGNSGSGVVIVEAEGDGGVVVIEDDVRPGGEAAGERGFGLRLGEWITRNRDLIEQGRDAVHVVVPLAPGPTRLPLIAASLAAEGLLTADDYRTGRVRRGDAGIRGVGLALDVVTLAASARLAPRALARNARGLATLRAAFARLEQHRRARG
jgi:hypothetical protein